MPTPRYPSLFQVNTRVRLSELRGRARPAGHARRHPGRGARPARRRRVRPRLVPRRLADRRGGARRLALEAGVARGVPPRPPRLPRGGRLRLVLRDPRVPRPRGLRRRRRRSPGSASGCAARPAAHPRLRPEPHGARSPVGQRAPGLLRVRHGGAARAAAAELRRVNGGTRQRAILAYGRDPYFDGWPDTLQLNYGNPARAGGHARRAAARSPSSATASAATWRCSCCRRSSRGPGASPPAPFWPRATDGRAREGPGLPLPRRGVLGPRVDAAAAGLRLHLRQAALRPARARPRARRSASTSARASTSRTTSRASSRTTTSRARRRRSPPEVHRAAAVVTFFTPGLRFFHQGQREGKRVRIPVHLGRGPAEPRRPDDRRVLRPARSSA